MTQDHIFIQAKLFALAQMELHFMPYMSDHCSSLMRH
jgi:hypothetical protein